MLRAEGPAAVLDRASDRFAEWAERARTARAMPGTLGRADVLVVLGFPAVARLGGVPLQLRHRLAQERRLRATALLAPYAGGWRLDWRRDARWRSLSWPAPSPSPRALEDAAFERVVERALLETDARAIHLEGLAGLPARSVRRVCSRGTRLVVTVHDFTPWCPRPHLWEEPAGRFCGFSRDADRCHACLSADGPAPRGFESEWRAEMVDLLDSAEAIVFPSAYLREAWRALLPRRDHERQHVIEPGALEAAPGKARVPRPVRNVALVGAVTASKGAGLLADVVRAAGGLRYTVLGGGEAGLLRRLRALPGTRVRGYYRAGSLPDHLRARRADVALLLSRVPESYGITLDECWRAGVPVVAFDHGSVAERVRRRGGGVLVPLESGASGVAATLQALRDGSLAIPDVPAAWTLPPPAAAARAHVEMYRRLGLLESGG